MRRIAGYQCGALATCARQKYREFISTQAGHGVRRPHDLPQPDRHRFQEQIAGMVSERVVDLLEAI
jgi:hypothetical protein